MQLTMRVAKVVQRTETITERDKEPRQQVFEDVLLEATGGAPFLGSAAGQFRLTLDNPASLGALAEGTELTVTIAPAS